jgi:hypothetical protein
MDKDTTDHILNLLRRGTVTWPGRAECLNRGRRKRIIGKKKDGEDKTLWERQCDECKEWHLLKDNDLEVDHIVEVGPFSGDFNDHIRRLYCHVNNLQALCFSCHSRKTSRYNSSLRFKRKNENGGEEDLL